MDIYGLLAAGTELGFRLLGSGGCDGVYAGDGLEWCVEMGGAVGVGVWVCVGLLEVAVEVVVVVEGDAGDHGAAVAVGIHGWVGLWSCVGVVRDRLLVFDARDRQD